MGNHTAGALIVGIAVAMNERRRENETARDVLSAAMDRAMSSSGFSTDVEFDDDATPDSPFGKLLIEVYKPESRDAGEYEDDDDGDGEGYDLYYDEVYGPFREEYGLC